MRNEDMSVRVNKGKLLDTVRENRDAHRSLFLSAQERYRTIAIRELDDRLRRTREGEPINLSFRLPAPEDYTEQYDIAIAMVEWEVGEEIELTRMEFEQFVLNKWSWNRSFAASTDAYLVE